MWNSLQRLIIKKDILPRSLVPTQGLGEHSLSAEIMCSINLTKINIMCLHYNGANSYFFVNSTELHKFNVKDFEIV